MLGLVLIGYRKRNEVISKNYLNFPAINEPQTRCSAQF